MHLISFLVLLQQPDTGTLIRQLDDDDIVVRRQAADDLYRRGGAVEEALHVAVVRSKSLEVRLVAKDILIRRARLLGRAPTVTDERRFGRLKDDPPQMDFDR